MTDYEIYIRKIDDLVDSKSSAMRVVVYLMSVHGISMDDFIDELLEYQR